MSNSYIFFHNILFRFYLFIYFILFIYLLFICLFVYLFSCLRLYYISLFTLDFLLAIPYTLSWRSFCRDERPAKDINSSFIQGCARLKTMSDDCSLKLFITFLVIQTRYDLQSLWRMNKRQALMLMGAGICVFSQSATTVACRV